MSHLHNKIITSVMAYFVYELAVLSILDRIKENILEMYRGLNSCLIDRRLLNRFLLMYIRIILDNINNGGWILGRLDATLDDDSV